jgi:hypothetical protein
MSPLLASVIEPRYIRDIHQSLASATEANLLARYHVV